MPDNIAGDSNLQIINAITQFVGGTQAVWNSVTVPVPQGLVVYATDTTVVKMGDGVTLYANLPVLFTLSSITSLTATINGLTANNTTSLADFNTLSAEYTTLSETVSALQTTVSGLSSGSGSGDLSTEVATLMSEYTTLTNEYSTLSTALSALQTAVTNLQNTTATAASVTALTSEYTTLNSEYTVLNAALTPIPGEISAINETLSPIPGEITNINSLISALQASVTTLQGTIHTGFATESGTTVDQTANRSPGTMYTNSTGRPLLIIINAVPASIFTSDGSDSGGTYTPGFLTVTVGTLNYQSGNASTVEASASVVAFVFPGQSYMLLDAPPGDSGYGLPTAVNSWYEI